jgi:signal transduction histidine kinase
MQRIVDRLSALSRPTPGSREEIDLRTPLGEAIEFVQPTFDEKSITLSVSLPDLPCTVMGNAPELEELFLNLLLNAYEATPRGGAVRVDAMHVGSDVVVTVADTGSGIPTDLLERIFEPFVTTKPQGSGLGLAISAGIVRTHEGRLRAGNQPSGGAIFTVELAMRSSASATRA